MRTVVIATRSRRRSRGRSPRRRARCVRRLERELGVRARRCSGTRIVGRSIRSRRRFHQATSRKDIDLMMSLCAPDATFTLPGTDRRREEGDPAFWLTSRVHAANKWVSDTPAYKMRITVNGDRGHALLRVPLRRPQDEKVVVDTAADQEVARINGRWLITSMAGASATAQPLRSCRRLRQRRVGASPPPGKQRPRGWGDNAVVRAVGRLPAKVHDKLLIAFAASRPW